MYVYTYIHHVCKYILRPNSIHPLFLPCKEMRNLHKTVVYIASDAIQGSLCNASKNYNFYLIKKNVYYISSIHRQDVVHCTTCIHHSDPFKGYHLGGTLIYLVLFIIFHTHTRRLSTAHDMCTPMNLKKTIYRVCKPHAQTYR